jgi:hypothetical protein
LARRLKILKLEKKKFGHLNNDNDDQDDLVVDGGHSHATEDAAGPRQLAVSLVKHAPVTETEVGLSLTKE